MVKVNSFVIVDKRVVGDEASAPYTSKINSIGCNV